MFGLWEILILVGIIVFNAGFTILLMVKGMRKATNTMVSLLEGIKADAMESIEALGQELEKQLPQIKRAQTIIGGIGADARKLKAAEKYIGEDILNQEDNALIKAGLEMLSPRTKEYFIENPDIAMKLLPRVKMILDKSGILEGALTPNAGTSSRPHPFGNREE